MKNLLLTTMTFALISCANLYKESSYVTEISGNIRGGCGSSGAQNTFILKTDRGEITVSFPVHYDYWWTGPIVIPMFPVTKERPDPSFIKISMRAEEDVLDRELLMKSEILVKSEVEPVKPLTVVLTKDKTTETQVIQFDSPKLVDIKNFRLKFDESISKEILTFRKASDVHYVPVVPVNIGNCVTD